MADSIIRFAVGGVLVVIFALVADVLRPKSFAGLFGAAPSVALATLTLTIRKQGAAYAAIEARSMIVGAIAFLCYAAAVSWLLRRYQPSTLLATISLMPIWFVVAFSLLTLCKGAA